MNTNILDKIEKDQRKGKTVSFNVGDSIAVHSVIDKDKEGKERVQIFKGIVIKIKGSGIGKTFIVRKIAHGGIGVEKTILINSPLIKKIEFIKKGKVRKAKLYYMRKRIGKAALKIMEGVMSKKELKELEDVMEEQKKEEKVETGDEVKAEAAEEQGPAEDKKEEGKKEEAKKEEMKEEKKEETKQEGKEEKGESAEKKKEEKTGVENDKKSVK